MDEQFGVEEAGGNYLRNSKFSNAYMLVYIRENDWPHVMCEVRASISHNAMQISTILMLYTLSLLGILPKLPPRWQILQCVDHYSNSTASHPKMVAT